MKTFREFCMEEKQDNLDEVLGLIKGIGQRLAQTKTYRQVAGEWSAIYDDIFEKLPEEDQELIQQVEKARSPGSVYSQLKSRLGHAQSIFKQGGDIDAIAADFSRFLDTEIRRKVPELAGV